MRTRRTTRKHLSPTFWTAGSLAGLIGTAVLAGGMDYAPVTAGRLIAIAVCLAFAGHCAIRSNVKATKVAAQPVKTSPKAVPTATTRRHTTAAVGKAA